MVTDWRSGNCGRWDYIFSYIKTLKQHADRVLPDRQSVTMSQPFLDAYSRLLIKTCHRRGGFSVTCLPLLIFRHALQYPGIARGIFSGDQR